MAWGHSNLTAPSPLRNPWASVRPASSRPACSLQIFVSSPSPTDAATSASVSFFFFFLGLPVPESRANPRNFDHCVRYAGSRIVCVCVCVFFFLLIFRCLDSRGVVLEINIRRPVLHVHSGLVDSLDI